MLMNFKTPLSCLGNVCRHNAYKCLIFRILLLVLHELYDQASASLSQFPLLVVIMIACFVFHRVVLRKNGGACDHED